MKKDTIYWRCPYCKHSYRWKWEPYQADHDTAITMECEDDCKREILGRMYQVGDNRYAVVFGHA
jgi:hypothetical protein